MIKVLSKTNIHILFIFFSISHRKFSNLGNKNFLPIKIYQKLMIFVFSKYKKTIEIFLTLCIFFLFQVSHRLTSLSNLSQNRSWVIKQPVIQKILQKKMHLRIDVSAKISSAYFGIFSRQFIRALPRCEMLSAKVAPGSSLLHISLLVISLLLWTRSTIRDILSSILYINPIPVGILAYLQIKNFLNG